MDIFLTEIQIFELTSLTKTELYQMIEEGEFPEPAVSDKTDKWLESEIHQWLNTKDLHISR
jgi:predicted DNA-binding transcriptional regulator AlpA